MAVTYGGVGRLATALALMWITTGAVAEQPLRIEQLQRCGGLLQMDIQEFCLQASGLDEGEFQVTLNGTPLPAEAIDHDSDRLRIRLNSADAQSGPLWLSQHEQASNPVWVSLKGSNVVAATEQEVAKNMDGITTYVDLVSLIIEESHDGAQEAQRLADKYGAEVVGMIPPLNTYQLRLPVSDLDERDALVLRLGNEVSVDAVVTEESGAEESIESETSSPPDADDQEWASNRFLDAVNFYQRRLSLEGLDGDIETQPIRIGVIEREVDFDAPDFADYLGECRAEATRTCVYARDAAKPDGHGTTVTGVLAAAWNEGGNSGFLRGLDEVGPGFDVIVDRNSDAGITANVAASVNLVEDGVRVLNWSWGIHRVGAIDINGKEIDSLVRSGIAMSGYEELLEEFFLWLREAHPDVVVVNSAGNASSYSGRDEYRLPSSFVTDQLFVVGGHQRSDEDVQVEDPRYVIKRNASNIDMRVDITAAACVRGSSLLEGEQGEAHCGTSYATPLVAGLLAAMMSIEPELTPAQLRMLLRRSAMTIGEEYDFEPTDADDLTAPILPSERANELNHPDIGLSARLNMYKALDLTVQSLNRER
ncbi:MULTISPECIES: S8/S53 family peptidase [Halomonadaceae]|uniref:S8/S53 family peptidase n=2 Tax=Vreelandella TaxID=3137766 RepID=A0A7Z0S039_9GAMM|nr:MULTISPECIES: S8/S53 family peptidase [Halomonas]AJY51916.1 peptidase S8 and S53 subtilisin kexin sedolisin [Halomonas sp. KO116]NYS79920.1 S8/S53 family peptidase [Halomonas glaciei]|tara:strand:+ start:473 stop:2248 length:1776 start_codon:yes stop_codon:yes gene_type:complete